MAKGKEQIQEKDSQQPEPKEVQKLDDRLIYAGPTIYNEKFFVRKGQIFTEVPAYLPGDLKEFLIPLSQYSPEKEKELEKKAAEYLKTKKRGE